MGKLTVAKRPIGEDHYADPLNPKIEGFGELRRREDMKQIAAISAFEGLIPSPEFEALGERYISGEISIKEFRKEIDSRWKRNG